MGFNKRYINEEILSLYKRKSVKELISFIRKSDCLIIEDSYSEIIYDIIINTKKQQLHSKLKEIGFYES